MSQLNKAPTLVDGVAYPSVSTILASDPKRKTFFKSRGARGVQPNDDSRRTSTQRGITLHKCFNDYLLTGEADIPPIYLDYWRQLQEAIGCMTIKPIWAEGPILPKHQHFRNGNKSLIWSKRHRYLGCPDLIGNFEGVDAVCEIKTSKSPYTKNYDRNDFRSYGSWFSYYSSALQVASYSGAWAEATGNRINTGLVINVMPDSYQLFIIEGPEMKSRLTKFRSLAKDYHKGEDAMYA